MPQPATGPATADATKAQLSLVTDLTDALVDAAVAAANRYVRRQRSADPATWPTEPALPASGWPEDLELGANMLAARLVRRRNSPDGVAALTDAGAVYIARTDPDIGMLLQVGAFARPAVG